MIWFTSDTHFYHTNVIKYCNRPFKDVEEMNAMMVIRWNEVVKPEDEIYHLGDFSMAWRPVEIFTPQLNGKKYLIPGNHDFIHTVHPKSKHKDNQDKWIARYAELGWTILPEFYDQIGMFGMNINMCHMPYAGDHVADKTGEIRYPEHRPKDDGKWLLHGHVHQLWRIKNRMINVGVDVNNFYPLSLKDIRHIIYPEMI